MLIILPNNRDRRKQNTVNKEQPKHTQQRTTETIPTTEQITINFKICSKESSANKSTQQQSKQKQPKQFQEKTSNKRSSREYRTSTQTLRIAIENGAFSSIFYLNKTKTCSLCCWLGLGFKSQHRQKVKHFFYQKRMNMEGDNPSFISHKCRLFILVRSPF